MKYNFVEVAIQRLKQTSPSTFKPSICSLDLYAGAAESIVIYLFILFSTIKITQTLNYTKMWRGDLKKPQGVYEEAPSLQ